MANAAFQMGFQAGQAGNVARRERKEKLIDEERQHKVTELYDRGHALAKLIPSMEGDRRDQAMKDLTDIEQGIAQVYHPDKNPGALQKDWHFLTGMIHKNPPHAAVVSTTTQPGVAEQSFTMGDQPITLPATPDYRTAALKPAAMMPVQKQREARSDDARRSAEIDVAAAGLSPEEEAQADSAKKLAFLRQSQKDYDKLNPSATAEQKAQFFADLVEKTYGIQQKQVWKEYVGPNGEKKWLDATGYIEPGWNAVGSETADTRTRSDYAAYLKTHPDYKGTLQQWKVEQGQLGKLAVPVSRDDRYIAIQQKAKLGQALSKDDQAYSDAYDMYVAKRITGPMLQRVAAQADARYVQVMDPDNPEKIEFVPAGVASRAKLGSPQSIGFQMDKAMSKYMTSGKGGENIGYFNTAIEHLKLLGETADALDNGDIQKLNQWGNAFATATGDPAPTDFETVKSAVAGELSKTFAGKSATVEEIAQINAAIYQAESPQQLHGAINMALRLMDGKLASMKHQYEQGKQGKPAFPDSATPPAGGGDKKTYKSYANNPQTHQRYGTNDDPHSPAAKWFDAETGKPVQP